MRLDHVVVLVRDLDEAIQDWRAQGFTVTPGGVHSDGLTHNALVCFADGSYVELLAFRVAGAAHRWARYRGFWGPIDFAIGVDQLQERVRRWQQALLPLESPHEGGRRRPDEIELRWRSAFPTDAHLGLPFFIEDITPRELRVPLGNKHTLHDNAASGIVQVRVGVTQLSRAKQAYDLVFGPAETQPNTHIYSLKGCQVYLQRPAEHSPEARFLAQRGEGVLAVTIGAPLPIVIRPEGVKA